MGIVQDFFSIRGIVLVELNKQEIFFFKLSRYLCASNTICHMPLLNGICCYRTCHTCCCFENRPSHIERILFLLFVSPSPRFSKIQWRYLYYRTLPVLPSYLFLLPSRFEKYFLKNTYTIYLK